MAPSERGLKLWEEVKENQAKLEACVLHNFDTVSEFYGSNTGWPRRYRCANCGGEVNPSDKRWYERGLKHASC